MFKTIRKWIYYYNRSKVAKKAIAYQIAMCKQMGKAIPPTPEEIEQFKIQPGTRSVMEINRPPPQALEELGVPNELILSKGAVSPEVAASLAENGLKKMQEKQQN